MEKSQVSLEYLILSVILIMMITTVLWYSLSINNNVSTQLKISQLDSFLGEVKSKSDIVCFQGSPARLTFTAYIPSGVVSSGLINQTAYYNFNYNNITAYISSVSQCNLGGSLPVNEGTYNVVVEAMEGYVNITY